MGIFGAAHRKGGQKGSSSLKSVTHICCNDEIWHSYTLPKEDPKNILIMWHIPSVLLTLAFFHRKSANFVISINTDLDCVVILIMSAKLATSGFLKTMVFWNKGYDVMT